MSWLYAAIPRPPLVDHLAKRPDDEDLLFAWQRIAGANPMMVRQALRLPPNFPVTAAHFHRALPNDSLEAALAEGRILIADYSALEGAENGVNAGRQKYITAPIAMFCMDRDGTKPRLRPVAIQVHQTPSESNIIFTPGDGWRWKMAKLAVQVADGNMHEGYFHLGQTHLVVGIALVSMYNTMSEDHPIHVLMEPHGEFTMAINASAKASLIARGGIVDRVMGAHIESTVDAVKAAMDAFVIADQAPPKTMIARGLDDTIGWFRDPANLARYRPGTYAL